ncbi:antitoxin Xre/MbcA/ParS toxin-binding domain-containing protein [Pseudomonas yamanorum]|uniref:antitoxin Xre/MbcA/ParS toxin-binding domain-containing protein n=1 Tax=Pseudomonas yamanorum TaxID=515393 RepID=UPI00384FE846
MSTSSAEEFWNFSSGLHLLKESERLFQIKSGFPAHLFQAMLQTFNLSQHTASGLLNSSVPTFNRRIQNHRPLDAVTSERLDRIASISHLAELTLGDRGAAAHWMSSSNTALGGLAPILLCETEIGAKQVRRALHALEWGGAA